MFDTLSGKLTAVFDRLRQRGTLNEVDVGEALREVRLALLEADVALPVVKTFIAGVRDRAIGAEVIRAVAPGQQVIKIVNDVLVEHLGGEGSSALDLNHPAPVPILMVGLQGSGKTTTSGKLALRLAKRERKRVLLASLDTQRPAAQLQLAQLAEAANVPSLPIVAGETPLAIAERALAAGRREGFDIVILDTAGRLSIDAELMAEVQAIRAATSPAETLLVVDAMTGQDAVNTARAFNEALGITGIVLTRMDGDARGGAALSMRAVTGAPIKLIGVGEKLDALEEFHPERVASRILGMGDVLSLIEDAQRTVDQAEAARLADKVRKGKGFDLNDFKMQIQQMRKMGGLSALMEKLPGAAGQTLPAGADEKAVNRIEGIINSMTPLERSKPEIIKASRKRRIAAGAGVQVQEVNRLLNQFEQAQKMMKMISKGGGLAKMMRGMKGMIPGGR